MILAIGISIVQRSITGTITLGVVFFFQNMTTYEESYADVSVHRLMLEDRPRTLAYKKAIFENKTLIEGKVVMDVGCGTGILSIFCAQAGAKTVHAVECSSMGKLARKVVAENGLDSVVRVHECKVEDLVLDEKVDVIVSEWMGFYLLHEGMLESVIYARDRFLKPGGSCFPESADLWAAACELPRFFENWDDYYGVKMKSIGEYDRESRTEPAVTVVKPEHLITEPSVLATFSMSTVTSDELKKITSRVLSPATRNGQYQGICLWFVVNFPGEEYVNLSTAPYEPETHWQQTAIVFKDSLEVEQDQPLGFEIVLRCREDDPRKYIMEVSMLDPETEEHPVPCACYLTKCIVVRTYLEQAMSVENDVVDE